MAKSIFSAALISFLLIATSRSADLHNGIQEWTILDGNRGPWGVQGQSLLPVMAYVSGGVAQHILASCVGSCGCVWDSSPGERKALDLVVSGNQVTGTFLACYTSEKLVKFCGAKRSYETQFKGTLVTVHNAVEQIVGQFLADGWTYKDNGGSWTACLHDPSFEEWLDVTLVTGQTPCGPDVPQGFLFITPRNGVSVLYQTASTASPAVAHPPSGMRVVYRQVSTDNNAVWYHVQSAGLDGWIPAADASCTRPVAAPPHHPVKPIDPNAPIITSTGSETAAARG
jgi:hypothetical protein